MAHFKQDGKDVYCKKIDYGALPNNTSASKPHDIPSTYTIIKFESFAKDSNTGVVISLPYVTSSGTNQINVQVDKTSITAVTGSNRSNFNSAYFVVYYTK